MIEQSFLNELAAETDAKIAKVVLNESYEITTFMVKQVTASTVEMEYMVPNGAVVNITKVQLKKADNSVIGTNIVFVPITSDTIIRHNIPIANKEV